MSVRKAVRPYHQPAGGWGALKALGEHLVEQGVAVKGAATLSRMNFRKSDSDPHRALCVRRRRSRCWNLMRPFL